MGEGLDLDARDEPLLVHHRIDENRRLTRLLLVVFSLALLPYTIWVLWYAAGVLAMGLGGLFDYREDALATVIVASTILAIVLVGAVTWGVYRLASRLALWTGRAHPVGPGEEPAFRRIVENLCIGLGLSPPDLRLVETTAINAWSTGLDVSSATLVVTRGALDALEPRELEGVVAQELCQIESEDTRLATIVSAFVTVLWLPWLVLLAVVTAGWVVLRLLWDRGGRDPRAAYGCLTVLTVLASLFVINVALLGIGVAPLVLEAVSRRPDDPLLGSILLILWIAPLYALFGAPVVGYLVRRKLGARRQLLSDARVLLLTRHPAGLPRALTKMAQAGNATMRTSPAMSHLCIADPLPPGPWRTILTAHPPIEERIRTLTRMAGTDPSEIEDAWKAAIEYAARIGTAHSRQADEPREEGAADEKLAIGAVTDPVPPASDLTCKDVARMAGEYLDDRLEPGSAGSIRAHLGTCNACDELVTRRIWERIQSG